MLQHPFGMAIEAVMTDKTFTAYLKRRAAAKPATGPAARKNGQTINWKALIGGISGGNTSIEYGANRTIFRQGDPADSLFYLRRGKVRISVTSNQGKKAIVTILSAGTFFGEGCLAGQALRNLVNH